MGLQLIQIVKKDHPGLPIIAISAFEDSFDAGKGKSATVLLKKPFSHTRLVNLVESIVT
jgi:DNA-binding NtrC family response regulator